jgi:hypothetical protein
MYVDNIIKNITFQGLEENSPNYLGRGILAHKTCLLLVREKRSLFLIRKYSYLPAAVSTFETVKFLNLVLAKNANSAVSNYPVHYVGKKGGSLGSRA